MLEPLVLTNKRKKFVYGIIMSTFLYCIWGRGDLFVYL